MDLLKFRADQLFTGREMLSDNHVLITSREGKIEGIVPVQDAGEDVQALKGLLTPGFINCHCHLELSHMKGAIPEKTGLVDFVYSIVTQRHIPEDIIAEAIADAEAGMIANGIVAVGDICNNQLTLPQKMLGKMRYYNFVEASGWVPSIAHPRFLRSEANYFAFSPFHPTTIVPHSPYSVSPELFGLIAPCFEGSVVTMHNQETAFEDELFLSNAGDFRRMYRLMGIDDSFFVPTGTSSLQSTYRYLEKAANIILVHNTFTQEADLQYIIQRQEAGHAKPYLCACINANLYIEDAIPPLDLFRQHKTGIVIGTDSLASNHSLSIWDEILTMQRYFPAIPLEEMLGWATFNGAQALQMNNTLGSFDKGKQPGVVWIDDMQHPQRLV